MTEGRLGNRRNQLNHSAFPIRVSIPIKATTRTIRGVKEYEGRLEAIGIGKAEIWLDHLLPIGTRVEILVDFKDRRNREIRFRYDCTVSSHVSHHWYQMEVSFKEGVGISGKDAREILSDLFPGKI